MTLTLSFLCRRRKTSVKMEVSTLNGFNYHGQLTHFVETAKETSENRKLKDSRKSENGNITATYKVGCLELI